ncbi:MAG: 16S rRNA (adenine(1518)-N(6)/adenine(1519)-N(6))-dimethyltransferase RsmA [Actinobacteria bacterium HGW-Actinobacteria-10]|jgi:16S rRNA (adenine1518-N6/adenine1519-N6)-dimethyltransferase|nr:MAG: 16S rRNA (adenine(1518)-N(6)/adenine(1519)-N(6))-dimethyltransferase RsmA [Actinobacteria bacterium HGW-Actinobacteria-10]
MGHSRLATPSATLAVLARHGLNTRKSLGQHFLVDDNVIGRILELSAPSVSTAVLEVGPGIGTLTDALCSVAGHVIAIERDTHLRPALNQMTALHDNLTVIYADAVTVPVSDLGTPLGAPVALVANLPYGVAATVVLRMFAEMPSLRYAVVMVQAEVADRMTASPGSKSYGAYSVKLQLLAQPTGRFAVSRQCFLPPPRVDSAVVRLDRRQGIYTAEEIAAATATANAAFAQRRKTLRNSLKASLGAGPGDLDLALGDAGIDGGLRAEMLSVQEFVRLGAALNGYGILP